MYCKDESSSNGQDALVCEGGGAEGERERVLGHYCSGLSIDDKGTGGAGGTVMSQSEKQTHYEYNGIWIYCRNRPLLL